MKKKNILTYFILAAALLYSGCTTITEKAGQFFEGSLFAEKKLAVYKTDAKQTEGMEILEVQNKAGERSVIITLNRFPTIKIRGTMPNEQSEFNFTALDYLGSSYHGWNEFRLDLFGSGSLVLGETTAVFSARGAEDPAILPLEISRARIRRYDTRITGDEALTNLRNRRERILALTEWLNAYVSEGDAGSEGDASSERDTDNEAVGISAENDEPRKATVPQNLSKEDFENYWKPILFPERVSKKRQPVNWQREGDLFTRAEDIRWNTSYTERVFTENLWQVRNSGTMLRDWEEALDWIYMEYEWNRILDIFSQETILNKIK